jgi:ERCC4-related helicase
MSLFQAGERVRIVGGPEGVVTEVFDDVTPTSYRVFVGALSTPMVSEPDLEPIGTTESDLGALLRRGKFASLESFRYAITHLKLSDQLTDTLLSYNTARIQIQAHQFKPLLKLLDSPYRRLLIADEVGLGKTIEAGIIMSEFELREGLDHVLVVCPHALLFKWRDELDSKFGFRFQIWSGKQFREWIESARKDGYAAPIRAIVGLEGVRAEETIVLLDGAPITLDMLVVDEAHHLRNDYTQAFALGESLASIANLVLFLSATPLNLRNRDLYNLVHLLLPEVYANEEAFESQIAPNQDLNRTARFLRNNDSNAEVRQAAIKASTGRLATVLARSQRFQSMLNRLESSEPLSREERVEFQRLCMDMNTLEGVVTRTRKTDVAAFAVREAYSIHLHFNPGEREFYDAVTAFCAARYSEHGGIGFGAVTYQRQVCSCIPAMRQLLEEVQAGTPVGEEDELEDETEKRSLSHEESLLLEEALQTGHRIGSADTKFDEFERLLLELLRRGVKRILVFSFFRRTIQHLARRLSPKLSVGVIMGGMSLDDRATIVESFRSGDVQVLLSSEVGSEGLDFQFCNVLVNYDLPWNPMRVEQRIGRLDRFGQKSDKILIYNFFVEETVETRVFGRLFDRIQLFTSAIGDLEAILGETVAELTRAAMDLELTEEQQASKAELLAQQILHRKALEDDLLNNKDSLLSNEQYLLDQFKSLQNGKSYVTSDELANFVGKGIERLFSESRITRSGNRWWLRPTSRFAEYVRREVYGAGADGRLHQNSHVLRPLSRLKIAVDADAAVPITFESSEGFDDRGLELMSPRHPYVQALVRAGHGEALNSSSCAYLQAKSTGDLQPGKYCFAVYRLESTGLRSVKRLESVLVSIPEVAPMRMATEWLGCLLSDASDAPVKNPSALPEKIDEALLAANQFIVDLVSSERDTIEGRQTDLVRLRMASLQFAFERKRDRLLRAIASVANPQIKRLRRGELRNATARHENQVQQLQAEDRVALTYDRIAVGLVDIL